jgi:hypothetical protein
MQLMRIHLSKSSKFPRRLVTALCHGLGLLLGRPGPALLVVGPALFALRANAVVLTLPISGASAVVLTPMLETGPDQDVARTVLDAPGTRLVAMPNGDDVVYWYLIQ